ncbi:oligosaccharide flippase family protein [soil metagenome]
MTSTFGRLARQAGLYTLANLGIKLGGLALLIFLLDPQFLSQADFGRHNLLDVASSLLIVVGGLGIATGLLKVATETALEAERPAIILTAVVACTALGMSVFLIVWMASGPLAAFLLDDESRTGPVLWMGAYAGLKIVAAVPYVVLRVREWAGLYVVAAVVEIIILVGGAAYLLTQTNLGLEGVWLAYAASAGLAAIGLSIAVTSGIRFRLRPVHIRRIALVGMPLALAGLASMLLNTGDQFLLKAFRDAETVAVYGLAAKYGSLINMLFVQSFNMAFAVIGLKALGGGANVQDGSELHRRSLRPYAAVTGLGVLGVSLLTLDVTRWLSPNPAFLEAEPLVLPIALGFLGYGVFFIMMNVLYAQERTRAVAINVGLAAGFNLLLNLAAIPYFGAMGAALATTASYTMLAVITAIQGSRAAPQAYPWLAIIGVCLVVLGLWALGQPSRYWDPGLRLLYRGGLIATYPLMLVVVGIYSREELTRVWRGFRRGRSKTRP